MVDRFFQGAWHLQLIPWVSILVLLLLPGCVQYEAAKDLAPIVIDKAVDKTYDLTCNMRYKTEARFRARHQITAKTVNDWCKRSDLQ